MTYGIRTRSWIAAVGLCCAMSSVGGFAQESNRPGDLSERFKRLDVNGDGKLSSEEVGRSSILRRADTDGDGALTRAEFDAYAENRDRARKRQRGRRSRRAAKPTSNAHFEKREFARKDEKLTYYLMTPAGYDETRKYPLVLTLHGAGGKTYATDVLGSDTMRKKYPCFVMAPMAPVEYRWAAPAARRKERPGREKLPLVLEALEKLARDLSIDRSRIYVTGQSMGGAGTWGAIAARPDVFAAAVPVCGNWDRNEAASIVDVPIWVFHGAADQVVPVSGSRSMVEAIKKAGGKPKYTEYEGVKHNSWTRVYDSPKTWEWLFAQKRSAPTSNRGERKRREEERTPEALRR